MTEQEKRDEIIKKLAILWTWVAVNPKYGKGLDVEDCVAAVPWLDEAIEALKQRRPRLVRAEDFLDENGEYIGIPCWKEPKSPTRRAGWAVIVYGKWLADKGVCRYWTGRPTDEQREAEPWQSAGPR